MGAAPETPRQSAAKKKHGPTQAARSASATNDQRRPERKHDRKEGEGKRSDKKQKRGASEQERSSDERGHEVELSFKYAQNVQEPEFCARHIKEAILEGSADAQRRVQDGGSWQHRPHESASRGSTRIDQYGVQCSTIQPSTLLV